MSLEAEVMYFEGLGKFLPFTLKHIILVCLVLYNFIRNNNLHDMKFERCDTDENYLVEQTSGMTQTEGDENPDVKNEDTVNTIHSRIADAFVIARGG